MPDNALAGLYPQPVNPASAVPSILQQNPLGAAQSILQIQNMQGQKAAGNALMQGLRPDGTFDPSAAVAAAQNGAPLGMAGSQFTGDLLTRRSQAADAATRELNLGVANQGALSNILFPYLGQDKLSNEDQYNIKAKAAAAGINAPTIAAADLNGPFKTLKAITLAAKQEAGAGAIIQPTEGSIDPETGLPTKQSTASTVGTGPRPMGMVPTAVASQQNYLDAQKAAPAVAENVTRMKVMLPVLESLSDPNFGPASAQWDKVRGVMVQSGLMKPTDTQLPDKQIVGKFMNQIIASSPFAGRSDDALNQAALGNANFEYTKPANIALIKNRIGMDLFRSALPQIYDAENPTDKIKGGFNNFASKAYQKYDPQVFAWDQLSDQDKGNLFAQSGGVYDPKAGWQPPPKNSPDFQKYSRFERSLRTAQQIGISNSGSGGNTNGP